MLRITASFIAFALLTTSANANPCSLRSGFRYFGDRLKISDGGQAWAFVTSNKLVDADGAPNAYHPDDLGRSCDGGGKGLDCLADAGYPSKRWWSDVLVRDPGNPDQPLVQENGAYQGYFVSMTSLRRADAPHRPQSYVDASRIPYLVLPAPILSIAGGPRIGDLGYAINLSTGKSTGFVVADEGPVEPMGEASIAFWKALGGKSPNAQTGEGLPDGRIAVVIFAGSAQSSKLDWPLSSREVSEQANALLGSWGGEEALVDCAGPDASSGDDQEPAEVQSPHLAAEMFDKTFQSMTDCQAAVAEWKREPLEALADLASTAACESNGEQVKVRVQLPS